MTLRQQVLLNMLDTMVGFFKKHPTLLTNRPALGRAVTELNTTVASIHSGATTQAQPVAASYADKSQARDELQEMLLEVNDQIAAWADEKSDAKLAEQVRLTSGILDRISDQEIETTTTRIYELAVATLPQMTECDLKQADLEQLDTLAKKFAGTKSNPRAAVATRSTAGNSIAAQIAAAGRLLRNRLDKLMRPLRKTDPAIATEYYHARVIVDHGAHAKANGAAGAQAPATPAAK